MTQTQFKELRRKLGVTQQQLADNMRVNVSTVWRWENGKTKVPVPVWLYLIDDRTIK